MQRQEYIRKMMVRPKPIAANTVMFDNQAPGSYSIKLSRGIYLLEISGGGGKAGMSYSIGSIFSGGGGGGGAAFKGKIRFTENITLNITVGKGGTGAGPTINGYGIAGTDGESGGMSKIDGIVECGGGRGGMCGIVRNNVAPGGSYNFLKPEIIVEQQIAGNGNNGGKGDMNSPASGANSKLTGDGGGKPHGGNGSAPGAGGAGTTVAVTWGGNGANGIVRLTYLGKP